LRASPGRLHANDARNVPTPGP